MRKVQNFGKKFEQTDLMTTFGGEAEYCQSPYSKFLADSKHKRLHQPFDGDRTFINVAIVYRSNIFVASVERYTAAFHQHWRVVSSSNLLNV